MAPGLFEGTPRETGPVVQHSGERLLSGIEKGSRGRAARGMQRGPDHPEDEIYLGDFGISQPEQVLTFSLTKYHWLVVQHNGERLLGGIEKGRKGTNGVSTNGVTANFMLFDRGTFWVLRLT